MAPFVYNAPAEAVESKSSLGSNETKDPETTTLRLKRSLTRILGPKEEDPNHQYHYQKQSGSRKGSVDEGGSKEGGRSRKGSFFGSSSFFEEKDNTASGSTPSTSGTKKIVSWIGQKQSGMTKKVQEVLKSGGSSSLQVGMPKAKSRISTDFTEDEDDGRSSISSAPSFVQNAPEDEVSRILSEPDPMPALPMQAQAPFQIPTNVFLPRSHTNLHAFTLGSLAFPPSLHPLLYIPNMPAFPRSSNPPSKLPRLPTFRAHLAKTRILDRLEAQDLTPSENESIMPFANRDENAPADPNSSLQPPSEGESEEGRKINDSPGRSVGLEAWTRRPPALQRFRVWQPDKPSYHNDSDGDNIKYEPLSSSTAYRSDLVISGGIKALAGLVPTSPTMIERELPDPPLSPLRNLPTVPYGMAGAISSESFQSRSADSLVIDESMLMDASEALPTFTPVKLTPGPTPSGLLSPRPLPTVPGNRPVETPTPAMAVQQMYWANQEEEHSPVIPVRPLPPRPLPMPPSGSPRVTVDELESIEGPVIVTSTAFTPTASPRQSLHPGSPPGSTNGHTTAHSHNGMPSSTFTSAPHTPMDPLEVASLRRMSMGSMSVVVTGAPGFSLEEMDGLEMTTPHDFDSKRRSVASFKTSVHKRRSTASRTSHASSPSLRNHPLPTLSESSRYSESSHLSSRQTHTNSASTSTEGLSKRKHPSTSSGSDNAEQVLEDLPSPVAVVAPGMLADIRGEEPSPLEPSRMSQGVIDPFIIPELLNLNATDTKLDLKLNEPPSLAAARKQQESLSIAVDLRTPTPSRSEPRSSMAASGPGSPTSSMQSPIGSESPYNADSDTARSGASPAPVKFVRLKRSGSTADSGSNGSSSSTTGGRLGRTLKDPSKFWPHNRRVDEKAEEAGEPSSEPEKLNRDSWLAERESMQAAAGTSYQTMEQGTGVLEGEDRPESGVSVSNTVVPHRESKLSISVAAEPSSPNDVSSLPPDLVHDVARLSDTSKLDLTLYTPQKTPPSLTEDLARRSMSNFSDSDSASRSADVREIAATMSPVPTYPGNRLAGPSLHARTPSNERAARIDAHLESVSATRYRPRMAGQPRPDFLPYPGSREYISSKQGRSDSNYAYSDGASEDEGRASGDQGYDRPPISPPPGSSFSQTSVPVSRPPARWSEAAWRDRQRTLNTLPLPSASISHSATRPLPYGSVLNRTGSMGGSSTPSIFRPNPSQPGAAHGRSLRM